MRLYLQWTKANPDDWVSIDLDTSATKRRLWERLPKKAEPVGGETIDDNPGWIFAVNVVGQVLIGADAYALEPLAGNAIRTYEIFNDLLDYPPGFRRAYVWTINPPTSQNTNMRLTIYAEPLFRAQLPTAIQTTGGMATILPWTDFVMPASAIVRYGITVPDALATQHENARTRRGWREWRPF